MRFSSLRPAWMVAALMMGTAAPGGAQDAAAPAETAAVAGADADTADADSARLLAETAGRLAALTEENDRLRAEVAALTEARAVAQARAQDLRVELQQRTVLTGAGIALGAGLLGMLLGRIGSRRRRSGF